MVLPEDDANRQLANGFLLHHSVATSNIQILEEAGGWQSVLERFKSDHVGAMDRYPERRMVLLLDFDGDPKRRELVRANVPSRLIDRVFVLGTLKEPEDIKREIGPYEKIGLSLAQDCLDGRDTLWSHPHLCHNAEELGRLRHTLRPILFLQL